MDGDRLPIPDRKGLDRPHHLATMINRAYEFAKIVRRVREESIRARPTTLFTICSSGGQGWPT